MDRFAAPRVDGARQVTGIVDGLGLRGADLAPLASRLGLERGAPRRYRCPAPACPGREKPRDKWALATPAGGGFRCHHCGAAGDALSLVALVEHGDHTRTRGVDGARAAERLREVVGMAPAPPAREAPGDEEERKRRVIEARRIWAALSSGVPL